MSRLARIAVLAGDTPGARAVAGAVTSLLTAVGRWVEELPAGADLAPYTAVILPRSRGWRAVRELTHALHGLEADGAPPPFALHARPATLFCTADALDRLGATGPDCEIAAHGDVHRGFADARTNLARVDRMLETFRAAGLTPRGFSPPNSTYSSELAPLLARFRYVRLGYQERALRFYPHARADGVLVPVSYYTDFLQRYVGPEECARLLGRFCTWAEATSVLAVPCFHPCLWPEPLRRFLEAPGGEAWEATLVELSDWWMRRRRALAAVSAAGEGAAPPELVLVRATPAERLAALRPPDGQARAAPRSRAAVRVAIGERQVSVVPAADAPAAAVEVPLARGWRPLGWLPGPLRRVASRTLVRVVNETGMHGCFYRDLGLSAEIVGGALRLPVVAADEPVLVRHRVAADLRRGARGLVRRLARRAHVPRADGGA